MLDILLTTLLKQSALQLKASGIDASAWKEVKPPPPKVTPRALVPEPVSVPIEVESDDGESGGGVFVLVLMVIAAIVMQVYHSKITAPIAPGQVLSPGGWVSKCGVASVFPSCENAYLEMGDDGVLSLFDAHGELEWKMQGSVCKSEDCIEGLEMREDSRLYVGGKYVQWVNVKKDAEPISPWPFAEAPKIKIIHAKK